MAWRYCTEHFGMLFWMLFYERIGCIRPLIEALMTCRPGHKLPPGPHPDRGNEKSEEGRTPDLPGDLTHEDM